VDQVSEVQEEEHLQELEGFTARHAEVRLVQTRKRLYQKGYNRVTLNRPSMVPGVMRKGGRDSGKDADLYVNQRGSKGQE